MLRHTPPSIALSLVLLGLLLPGSAELLPAETLSARVTVSQQTESGSLDKDDTSSHELLAPLSVVHPLVVALFQTLASLLALVAFSTSPAKPGERETAVAHSVVALSVVARDRDYYSAFAPRWARSRK